MSIKSVEFFSFSPLASHKRSPRTGGTKTNRKRKLGKEEATSMDYEQYHRKFFFTILANESQA